MLYVLNALTASGNLVEFRVCLMSSGLSRRPVLVLDATLYAHAACWRGPEKASYEALSSELECFNAEGPNTPQGLARLVNTARHAAEKLKGRGLKATWGEGEAAHANRRNMGRSA